MVWWRTCESSSGRWRPGSGRPPHETRPPHLGAALQLLLLYTLPCLLVWLSLDSACKLSQHCMTWCTSGGPPRACMEFLACPSTCRDKELAAREALLREQQADAAKAEEAALAERQRILAQVSCCSARSLVL